jgi:hypothetical protein
VPYDGAGLNVKVAVPADTTSSIHTRTARCYGNGGVQVLLLLIHSQNSSESIDSFLLQMQKWFQDANSLTCPYNAPCILLTPPGQG